MLTENLNLRDCQNYFPERVTCQKSCENQWGLQQLTLGVHVRVEDYPRCLDSTERPSNGAHMCSVIGQTQ